jgi:uncharacterized damage-inducible protein DinB
MSEIDRFVQHYDRAVKGLDPWHGSPVWTILNSISAGEAAARPVAKVHSIWEIVAHMAFWEGVVTRRLGGERAGLVEELNFPPTPEPTEESWKAELDRFRASNEAFRQAASKLTPERLDELTAAGKRTYREEVQGILEHHLYHLGQIALLKKALS